MTKSTVLWIIACMAFPGFLFAKAPTNSPVQQAQHYFSPTSDAAQIQQGITLLRQAAKKGNPAALFALGQLYDQGKFVASSLTTAFHWYLQSAQLGYPLAQEKVAYWYGHGLGTSRNIPEAMKWYLAAAKNGVLHAQLTVANAYLNGNNSFKKDSVNAATWFEKAAKQGDASAEYYLGLMYLQGVGINKDTDKGLALLKQSAQQAYVKAQMLLAYSYNTGSNGVPQNNQLSAKWYLKAANAGIPQAEYMMGYLYQNALGVPENDKMALHWYTLAANHGNGNAQLMLGVIYHEGKLVKRDDQLSYVWLNLAGASNDAKVRQAAMKFKTILSKSFTEKQIEAAQALTDTYDQRISQTVNTP